MAYLIGIDIGTSGTKTLLIDESGTIVATATASYDTVTPRPAWSEQDPALWVEATAATVRQVMNKMPAGTTVGAIGLSGQMHGSVFVNRQGKVLRSAILWNDQRTGQECEEITRLAGGRKALIRMVANPALAGFTAPKILWVRRHQPRIYERTAQILLPKDYVRYVLTGEFATEVSDASGTLLLDVARRQWCKPLLSKLAIDPGLLPKCYESPEVSAVLSRAGGELLGLPAGIPVVGGGGDNAAGAVGNGIVRRGVVSASIGTSGVVFAHSDELQTDPEGRVHTFCTTVPGKWHIMGVVLSAGGSLQWYRNRLGESYQAEARRLSVDAYELITADAARSPVGSHGLIFLPYLNGERTPHGDPHARGCWIGLSNMHGRSELARSIMEGITFAMRDSLEIIRGMNVPVRQVISTGGGARSEFWRQMQADVYGQAVSTINAAEGPAYGAALLAGVGAGVWATVPEASDAVVKVQHAVKPKSANRLKYEKLYRLYTDMYPALKRRFEALSSL